MWFVSKQILEERILGTRLFTPGAIGKDMLCATTQHASTEANGVWADKACDRVLWEGGILRWLVALHGRLCRGDKGGCCWRGRSVWDDGLVDVSLGIFDAAVDSARNHGLLLLDAGVEADGSKSKVP